MKFKSIIVKSLAVAAFTLAGAATLNTVNNNTVHAATTTQNSNVVTVRTNAQGYINVYNSYVNPVATGQTLKANSHWKVIKTVSYNGATWYDLGKNQWVKGSEVVVGWYTSTKALANSNYTAAKNNNYNNSNSNNSSKSYSSTTSYSSTKSYSSTSTTTTTTTSSSSSSEAAAKAWIANKESGGSYTASNGNYYGKYQLSKSLLNGDYSAANQEKVANAYVLARYGSWTAAKAFWEANGWY
ncbi:hypothetical protein [Lactobacillus corticis]|uniref:Aggregation promoting factor n=1 Tax=Lactobacillus corticis TaxID=2201249 RepID=A0A916QHI8_9LACO|nr:hypothetical protein [Lactobacillus corticis]GFZ26363.1 aggregation promoting factor [Lactobacillus corticis]